MTVQSECILWDGKKNKKGYGYRWTQGRTVGAHRVAYTHANGLMLDDIIGKVVRHKCDNPSCVNYEHLELGSIADNNRDRSERGRNGEQRGVTSPNVKLTEEQVLAIRESYIKGSTTVGGPALGRLYRVDASQILHIIHGRQWASLL